MKYLRSFHLSPEMTKNPNLYPYNSLNTHCGEILLLDTITILYGNNGSGKSTILNLLATKLNLPGNEPPKKWGKIDYFQKYLNETTLTYDTMESGISFQSVPEDSRYIKSEDILYEIKKIQQEAILAEGYLYERGKLGKTKADLAVYKDSSELKQKISRRQFAQEKYSNGETALQVFDDYLTPNGLYLLDEPEASLSPENQLKLIQKITDAARFFNCQFVISTHSPFLLGSLEATIYHLDLPGLQTRRWNELESMRTFQQFFTHHQDEF